MEKYNLAKNKMFSEQFFDLLLAFGDNWKVERVYANIRTEEVDVFVEGHKNVTLLSDPISGVIVDVSEKKDYEACE